MKQIHKSQTVPEYLRDGRFLHLEAVLDQEPPWVLRTLVSLLSSRVRIDDHVAQKLRDLAGNSAIVYAMKYRSTYDLHFLRMRFAALGLPVPSFVFDASVYRTGSFKKTFKVWQSKVSALLKREKQDGTVNEVVLKQILDAGDAAVLFLVDEKTSRSRYLSPESDPIQVLLDLQGRMAKSIAVVPMMILYDRAPRTVIRPFGESFFGDPDQPGLIRRILSAIRHWTVPELLVGEPVHMIAQFEEFGSWKPSDTLPFEVRKELIESVNARIRVSRGPEKLSATEIKERVLQDPRVQRAVREMVNGKGVTETKVRKKAESYVDEIAADPHLQVHHFLYYVLQWMFRKVFAGVDLKESDFAALKQLTAQGSLIFVPCHKSHFDYLLLGFLCFINDMAVPYFAAGKNLSFWPVGPLLRNGGAFFLRRTFRGLDLYTHVFAAYLKVLVKEKANIIFYLEGGRSRTGTLLTPKVGLLTFLLQTVEEDAVDDLTFVPTFIGYDQIPEENTYLRELAGRDKQKESLFSVIRAREILKESFGKVYVRFDKPVRFTRFCNQWGMEWQSGKVAVRENRKFVNDFAYHLMHGIVRSGVVTPIGLVAAGLVCSGLGKVPHEVLVSAVQTFSLALRKHGFEFAESLDSLEKVVQEALGLFKFRGFVETEAEEDAGDTLYTINELRRANLQFYKNSLINYLWPESLVASAVIGSGFGTTDLTPEIHEAFGFLKDLLSQEIIVDPLEENNTNLETPFHSFVKNGWIPGHVSGVEQTGKNGPLQSLSGILADILEIYYLALCATEGMKSGGINQKEFAKQMVKAAEDLLSSEPNRAIPSMPMVLVGNALNRFAQMGILDYSHSRKYIKSVSDPVLLEQTRNSLAKVLKGRITFPGASS